MDTHLAQSVMGAGREFRAYGCDFSDRPALYAAIHRIKAEAPAIDILINNAGPSSENPPPSTPMNTGMKCSKSTSPRPLS
jgi:2-deoxy-D-gluconate 3-dehydrogenase